MAYGLVQQDVNCVTAPWWFCNLLFLPMTLQQIVILNFHRKKINISTGSHNARSARPVSNNQCNRWTRQDCRNQRHNSFLIHNIPLNRPEREGWAWVRNGSRRKGGLWLKAGNDEVGDEGIRMCSNAVAYWYLYNTYARPNSFEIIR